MRRQAPRYPQTILMRYCAQVVLNSFTILLQQRALKSLGPSRASIRCALPLFYVRSVGRPRSPNYRCSVQHILLWINMFHVYLLGLYLTNTKRYQALSSWGRNMKARAQLMVTYQLHHFLFLHERIEQTRNGVHPVPKRSTTLIMALGIAQKAIQTFKPP